jgi:hypothetical protein
MPKLKRRRSILVAALLLAVASAVVVGQAVAGPSDPPAHANPDSYTTGNVGTLAVNDHHGVLSNDSGHNPLIIGHTDPSNGSLTLNPDGSFQYIPQSGFTGDDSFNYTITNAVQLFKTNLPPLGFFGSVTLTGGAFGSSLYPDPGHDDQFYGLEDRGPNVSAPNCHDVLPIPTYDPGDRQVPFQGRQGRARAPDPANGRQRASVLRSREQRQPHRRDDRGPERPRAGQRPERLRPRGPRRDEGRLVLGLRRVRPVHHALQRTAVSSSASRRSTARCRASSRSACPTAAWRA